MTPRDELIKLADKIISDYNEHYSFPWQGESHMHDCIMSALENFAARSDAQGEHTEISFAPHPTETRIYKAIKQRKGERRNNFRDSEAMINNDESERTGTDRRKPKGIPEAVLRLECFMVNPPKPAGFHVFSEGKTIAIVSLDSFDKARAELDDRRKPNAATQERNRRTGMEANSQELSADNGSRSGHYATTEQGENPHLAVAAPDASLSEKETKPFLDVKSPIGTKVVFDPIATRSYVPEYVVFKHLEIGKVYTISRIDVHSWNTTIYLTGFDRPFNSAWFYKYEEPSAVEAQRTGEPAAPVATDAELLFCLRVMETLPMSDPRHRITIKQAADRIEALAKLLSERTEG